MSVEGWIALVLVAVAGILFLYGAKAEKHGTSGNTNAGPNRSTRSAREIFEATSRNGSSGHYQTPPSSRDATRSSEDTETDEMIYFANGGDQNDKEYRFKYKKVRGAWRAYITRTPSFRGRDTSGAVTHRYFDTDDHNKPYICWDTPIYSLKDMQAVSRHWADCIQKYIATGERFG